MIVLFDLEWIEKEGIHPTQLSALRVNESWEIQNDLDIVVNPGSVCLKEANHIALGGLFPALFSYGVTEQDAIETFSEWLMPDDEVWVWAKSNLRLLGDLWIQWLPDMRLPHVYSMAEKARKKALKGRYDAASPFTMLARLHEKPPFPEHRARNDVEAMRRLFLRIGLKRSDPAAQAAALPTQRERNQKTIDKTEYNFLFLKNSGVFHTRTCRTCLNARHTGNIQGSVYYETAAESRRPCKLCKPVPPIDYLTKKDKEAIKCAEKAPERELLRLNSELVKAKMLTGETIQIKRGNILGWCHHNLHKGAVNRSILKDHDCLGKNCPFLERNDESPFWAARAQEAAEKEKLKALKRPTRPWRLKRLCNCLILRRTGRPVLTVSNRICTLSGLNRKTPAGTRCSMSRTIPLPTGTDFLNFWIWSKSAIPGTASI